MYSQYLLYTKNPSNPLWIVCLRGLIQIRSPCEYLGLELCTVTVEKKNVEILFSTLNSQNIEWNHRNSLQSK